MVPIMEPKRFTLLRWPEPIYMRVGYVFESRFSAGMIKPISMIFGILYKKCSNFKKMLFIFLLVKKRLRLLIGICLKPHFYKKSQ